MYFKLHYIMSVAHVIVVYHIYICNSFILLQNFDKRSDSILFQCWFCEHYIYMLLYHFSVTCQGIKSLQLHLSSYFFPSLICYQLFAVFPVLSSALLNHLVLYRRTSFSHLKCDCNACSEYPCLMYSFTVTKQLYLFLFWFC